MRSWYRTARLAGISAIVLSLAGMVCAFPFVYGDPASFAESQEPDPAWFPVMAAVCMGLLAVGLLVLLSPAAHRLLTRRRS